MHDSRPHRVIQQTIFSALFFLFLSSSLAAIPMLDASLAHQSINRFTTYTVADGKSLDYRGWQSFDWSYPLPDDFVLNSRYPHWFLFQLYNPNQDTLRRLIYTDFYSLNFQYYTIIDTKAVLLPQVNISNSALPVQLDVLVPPGDSLKILARLSYQWSGQFFPRFKEFRFFCSDSVNGQRKLKDQFYANPSQRSSNAIFLAIIFFLLLFTTFQYAIVREQVYLLYAFYLFSLFIYYLLKKALLLNFSFGISLFQEAYVPASILLIFSYVLFIERFLNIKQRLPDVYNLFKVSLITLGVFLAVYFMAVWLDWGPHAKVAYLYLRSLLIPLGLFVVYRIFMLKDTLSKFIIVGTGMILVFGLLSLANEVNSLIRPVIVNEKIIPELFSLSFTQYGIFAEILCFSLGLGYRTKVIQQNNLDLQHKLLRSQLKPHFIFNALNAIKSLITLKKNDQAENYLVQFSGLLREVLIYSEKEIISLYDELEFTKKYLDIENLRFNQELNIHFQVDNSIDLHQVKIPPLTLQPIIENALWHGLKNKSDSKKLWLTIEHNGNQVRVTIEDNGQGRKEAKKRTTNDDYPGFGEKITRQRLDRGDFHASMYTIDLEDTLGQATGTRVVLDLPYPQHDQR